MLRARKAIIAVILLMTSMIALCACKKDEKTTYSVSGNIVGVDDYLDIIINVGGNPVDGTIGNDGSFSISGLNPNDIITVEKTGYTFNSYTVTNVDATGVEIVGVKNTYETKVTFDKNLGAVTYKESAKYNEENTITVTPNGHIKYEGIYDEDTLISSATSYTYTVTENRDFSVKFSKILYPITFTQSHAKAYATISADKMSYGDSVTLSAKDDDNYEFQYWIVNNNKIYDKTYDYVINSTLTSVKAVFLERMSAPVFSITERVLTVNDIEGADSYKLYVGEELVLEENNGFSVDLDDYIFISGKYKINVVVNGEGFAENSAAKSIDYVRVLDAPKNVGFEFVDGRLYLTFNRVLGAVNYDVYVDGVKRELNVSTISNNIIKVDIDDVFSSSHEYTFEVVAKSETESRKSEPEKYRYIGELCAPNVTRNDNIVSWSHENKDVKFTVAINGVIVKEDVEMGSIDISDYLIEEGESVTVVAKLDGYKFGKLSIDLE